MSFPESEWTFWLLVSAITVSISSSFFFGYGIGAPNQYNVFISSFVDGKFDACDVNYNQTLEKYNCTVTNTLSGESDESLLNDLKDGLGQTLFVVGNFIGALTCSLFLKMTGIFDRRRIFYVNYAIAACYAGLILGSYYGRKVGLFYFAMFVHGYQGGMACAIVPPYLNEITPKSLRGFTGTFHQLSLTIGILFGQIIGLPVFMRTFTLWPWGLALGSVTCMVATFILPCIADSPVQMISVTKRTDKAEIALRKLRKEYDPNELVSLQNNTDSESRSLTIIEVMKSPKNRWQMITALVMMQVQALSGINAIFFYSNNMFATAGIPESVLPYATLSTGLINVISTVAVLPLIERFGRRPLIIFPMGIMIALMVTLTTIIQVNLTQQSSTLSGVAVVITVMFIVMFAIGLGPIPFIYTCEVFRPEARDAALSVSLCVNYFWNIVISLFFLAANRAMRGYVFLLFAVVMSASLLILAFKMPETKNKSVEEIEELFYGRFEEESMESKSYDDDQFKIETL